MKRTKLPPLYPIIDSKLPAAELTEQLREWEPWGHRIDFTNGVSTKDLERRVPFSENTLQKLEIVLEAIGTRLAPNARALDIGCNSGYNSMAWAQRYGDAVGIDVTQRHIDVSTALAEMTDLSTRCTFKLGDAEVLDNVGDSYQAILHFGTLYHLPNPLQSLKRCADLLTPGGWLAIETQIYTDPHDENTCYFMHMQNNDPTNFWALSRSVLERWLAMIGFGSFELLLEVRPPIMAEGMSRIVGVVQKQAAT